MCRAGVVAAAWGVPAWAGYCGVLAIMAAWREIDLSLDVVRGGERRVLVGDGARAGRGIVRERDCVIVRYSPVSVGGCVMLRGAVREIQGHL